MDRGDHSRVPGACGPIGFVLGIEKRRRVMAINKKTVKELKELLKKIKDFEKGLPRLRKNLAWHIGQQKRQPSGW